MQTVNLQYNVPAGYSLEEFVAKVNSYMLLSESGLHEARIYLLILPFSLPPLLFYSFDFCYYLLLQSVEFNCVV